MEVKLQEKFALLQQMKRDKERKEAKARESRPIDIFAIAGVTLSSPTGGLNMTICHDGSPVSGAMISSVKRPPVRNDTQGSPSLDGAENTNPASDPSSESGSMQQSPETDSTTDEKNKSSNMAAPPTPIASPKADTASRRNSESASLTKLPVKDMTQSVQSQSGSVDEDEEMVIDMFGRSVPRSRHHSSDEGSDSENERADGDRRRERRGGDRDGHDRYSGDEMPPLTPAEEADPFMAASRYLDTAFYPTKIYVGNLPSSTSLTTLRTLFSPFGDIDDMNLVEGKDFGFITYVEPTSAQQALVKMNGVLLEGTYIRVNRAKIPERNRRGFAGVAWMDEDGELARLEEEQHQQAVAVASGLAGGISNHGEDNTRNNKSRSSSIESISAAAVAATQPIHRLPARSLLPKLPPRPIGAAMYPPVGIDPRAAVAVSRGVGRQILRYDDL
ncbi:hypothetical protein BGZ65_005806 [Modicella reniformis]|uniref:RRM domain-containing protein n=1 Tax=Modicella reniformis TaxID=1440133 RepID=A0A9P6LU53_9FUNG|nr:hypothetical protein BGZ65_005806 [Modicella reniformis]